MAKKFQIKNTMIYHDYYARLKMIALSIFKWEGLPKSCNARFLEDTLFHYGIACFVDDETMGKLNLKVTHADSLNVYNEPTSYMAFSTGYSEIFDADEIVIVRNNLLEKSTDSTIMLFAERLARIQISMDLNIDAQKTPVFIRCDEKTRTSLEAVYNQYEGGRPVIFGSKSLSEKPIEVLKTDAPFVADKLREEKRAVWNEALEFLGINTNPSDKKKERLVVNEVDANNEQIDVQSTTFLMCRQKACEDYKALFNEEIKVSINYEELTNVLREVEEGVI